MKTLTIIFVFISSVFSVLHAQSNSVVNFGIPSDFVWSTDGYIDDEGNKIALLSTGSGVAIGSFKPNYAPNWVKIVNENSYSNNTIIPLSNGDFVVLIDQDFAGLSEILKFDALGNIHWQKKINSAGSRLYQAIQIGENKIAIIGRTGLNAMYTVFDFNGDIVYSKKLNNAGYPIFLQDILLTGDGNHLIISHFYEASWPTTLVLSKFNESGDLLWDKVYEFPFSILVLNGLSSSTGDLFVVGQYRPLEHYNSGELLLLKFSSEGDFLQSKTYGNMFEENLVDLQEDVDGTFIGIGTSRPTAPAQENLLIVNFDQNLDTLFTKIYGKDLGGGILFHDLHKNGDDYYSFGNGNLWSNIGDPQDDGHLIQSDKNFDLGCEYYGSGLQNSGTIPLTLITPVITYPEFIPVFINYVREDTISFSVKDACTGEILSTEALNPAPAQLSVYPVPARDNLNIRINIAELEELVIYDMRGRIFFQQSDGFADELTLNIADWPSQQYILVVKHADGVQFEKILKID